MKLVGGDSGGNSAGNRAVKSAVKVSMPAWDGPTRLYHWTQLALVCGSFYTQWWMNPEWDPTMRLHRWLGYGVLILVMFRVLWGFAGSPTSRFANFLPGPATLARYGREAARGHALPWLGHNPLGALMVALLLLLLAAQGISGLFTADSSSLFGGPFGHYDMMDEAPAWKAALSRWHHLGAVVLLAAIGVHVLANILYQLLRREPLITAMVTGDKPARAYADAARAVGQGRPVAGRALLCLALAVVVVLGGISLAGGVL